MINPFPVRIRRAIECPLYAYVGFTLATHPHPHVIEEAAEPTRTTEIGTVAANYAVITYNVNIRRDRA